MLARCFVPKEVYITLEMLKEFYLKAKTIDAWLFEAKIKPAFLCLFSKSCFFFFLIYFTFGCAGSSLWHEGSVACRGFFSPLGFKGSRCGARALERMGSVVTLWHVGS